MLDFLKGKNDNKEKIKPVESIIKIDDPINKTVVKKTETKIENKFLQENFVSKKIAKIIKRKKIYIFLIENSKEVLNQKDALIKIVKSIVNPSSEELFAFINYGNDIIESKIIKASDFNETYCFISENVGGKLRFYDSLVNLELFFQVNFFKIKEEEFDSIQINEAEIIGIGTCQDIGSYSTEEIAIDAFCEVAKRPLVKTKYFCVSEEGYIKSSKIGFRSIGSTPQKYQ